MSVAGDLHHKTSTVSERAIFAARERRNRTGPAMFV
jgi:hypothetical protein